MQNDSANVARGNDGRLWLARAAPALVSGVVGWLRLDLAAQAGVLHAPVPTVQGRGWDDWFRLGASAEVGPDHDGHAHYAAAVQILERIVARLTRPAFHGMAWLQLSGNGRRLDRPTHALVSPLVAIAVAAGQAVD